MIKAIQNDWKPRPKKNHNTFNEYEQNKYDFTELEKQLLEN